MSIADTINPFCYQNWIQGFVDPATGLYKIYPSTVLFSAIDSILIAGEGGGQQWATSVSGEYDLTVYALDVELVTDLVNSRINQSRNISIYCRTLTITPPQGEQDITIDVTAQSNPFFNTPAMPDLPARGPTGGPVSGDTIAQSINQNSESWNQWFQNDPRPGKSGHFYYGVNGQAGGIITIACETLILGGKLNLIAKGQNGYAGIGGQSAIGYPATVTGGDAGKGGNGGNGGTIILYYRHVLNSQNIEIVLDDSWLSMQADAGLSGTPGVPGGATDAQGIVHSGNAASSNTGVIKNGDTGTAVPDDLVFPDIDPKTGKSIETDLVDLSLLAFNSSLEFWNLLYHRAKIDYLQNQPLDFTEPSTLSSSWKSLGKVLDWAYRFSFIYGCGDHDLQKNAFISIDSDADELVAKATIATTLRLMRNWYLQGKNMWGFDVDRVPPASASLIAGLLKTYFPGQKDVRDMYIKLREEQENAIIDQKNIDRMRQAADYAVELHKSTFTFIKESLLGNSNAGGIDPKSALGSLLSIQKDCDDAFTALQEKLSQLVDKAAKLWDMPLTDVLEGLQQMFFVVGDPPAFLLMAGAKTSQLLDKSINNIYNDAGVPQNRRCVINQIDIMIDNLKDAATLANTIGSDADRKASELVLVSLDNIEKYLSSFTSALGDVATQVKDDVDNYRNKVNMKIKFLTNYNNSIYEMTKEYNDWQDALVKQQQLDDADKDKLSANMIATTAYYSCIYLMNLEKTADLVAQLTKKCVYITSGSKPNFDYVGDQQAFWNSDLAGISNLIQTTDKKWNSESNPVLGSTEQKDTVLDQLTTYESETGAINLLEPSANQPDARSTYYITLDGANSHDAVSLGKLLKGEWLYIKVRSDAAKMTDDSGYILNDSGTIWDARAIKVQPIIQGVVTQKNAVRFTIKMGAISSIYDVSGKPHSFSYDYDIITDFAHKTEATIDPNESNKNIRVGDGDGSLISGVVDPVNNNEIQGCIDSRGVFATFGVCLLNPTDSNSTNYGLKDKDGIEHVKLRLFFTLTVRNKTRYKLRKAENE